MNESILRIKGADYNPRKISEDMIVELKQSIQILGVCRPIIVNNRNKTIIAGHQRVRALIALGITTAPVFYIEKIGYESEVRINQIHNAIEDTERDIEVTVCASSKTGFIMTRDISAAPKNTIKALNYVYIINRYGNIDSAVATQSGYVIKGKDYLLACKMMHIPARIFYIEDGKKDDALRFLYKDYGQFCYDGKANNSYQQNMAQMNRLGSNKKANYSHTYALALKTGVLRGKRTLDFGAGKCAFAEKLKEKGFDITPLEFFRVKRGGKIDSEWVNGQIDKIINDIKQKGLYDVVICDSVLNSVVSQEVESDVINSCSALLDTNGILIISGRINKNYKSLGLKRTIRQLDDKGFTMNMRNGEWYAQHFHNKEDVRPLLERHGLIVTKLELDTQTWRAICKKGEINIENCLKSVEREFNMKYNKNQSYEKGQSVKEALSCVYC